MGGILYLIDTAPEQGAFTCVPGFHRRIADWLASLPPGADPSPAGPACPRSPAGRAGDLVIWNDALPHGLSRLNHRLTCLCIVQYIEDVSDRAGDAAGVEVIEGKARPAWEHLYALLPVLTGRRSGARGPLNTTVWTRGSTGSMVDISIWDDTRCFPMMKWSPFD